MRTYIHTRLHLPTHTHTLAQMRRATRGGRQHRSVHLQVLPLFPQTVVHMYAHTEIPLFSLSPQKANFHRFKWKRRGANGRARRLQFFHADFDCQSAGHPRSSLTITQTRVRAHVRAHICTYIYLHMCIGAHVYRNAYLHLRHACQHMRMRAWGLPLVRA